VVVVWWLVGGPFVGGSARVVDGACRSFAGVAGPAATCFFFFFFFFLTRKTRGEEGRKSARRRDRANSPRKKRSLEAQSRAGGRKNLAARPANSEGGAERTRRRPALFCASYDGSSSSTERFSRVRSPPAVPRGNCGPVTDPERAICGRPHSGGHVGG